jgi:hypothetical protein
MGLVQRLVRRTSGLRETERPPLHCFPGMRSDAITSKGQALLASPCEQSHLTSKRLPLTLGLNWLVANSAYTLSPQARGEGKKSASLPSPR